MDLRLFLLVPRGRLSFFPGQSPRLFAAVVQRDVVRGHGISCRRRPGFSLCSVAVFSRILTSLPVFAAGLAVVARGWVRVRNHTWGLAVEQWNPGGLSGGSGRTVFGTTPTTPVVTGLDPFPFVGDRVLLPFGIGRHVLAPPARVTPSAVAARPPCAPTAVIAIDQHTGGIGWLGSSKGDIGARCLVPRVKVDQG